MPESLAGIAPQQQRPLHGFAEQQNGFGADDTMSKRETLELVRAYNRITDPNIRKRMLDLIKSMGPPED